jgi:TRAP-type mannitol/chloroaromatic compound transport system permease small subunit
MDNSTYLNSTDVGDDVFWTPEGEMVTSISVFSILFLTVVFGFYIADFYFVQEHKKRSSKPASLVYGSFSTTFKKSWAARDFTSLWVWISHWLMNPPIEHLHGFTMANFIVTICYQITFTTGGNYPTATDEQTSWLIYTTVFLYGIAKFCVSGYYITRYQIVFNELKQPRSNVIFGLWFLCFATTAVIIISIFNTEPYIALWSDDAECDLVILYTVLDAILNIILVYLFISPISENIRAIKAMQKNDRMKSASSEDATNNAERNTEELSSRKIHKA